MGDAGGQGKRWFGLPMALPLPPPTQVPGGPIVVLGSRGACWAPGLSPHFGAPQQGDVSQGILLRGVPVLHRSQK